MAIFQFGIQVIGRSEGRSAVAAAAYRSASKIENEYTGTTEDYSKKKWVTYSEVMLPENAPKRFQDRAVLWNEVERTEKGRNARLAREIEVALPIELSMEENIRLVRDYVQNAFISEGMIADVNIHCPPVTDAEGVPVDRHGKRVKDEGSMVFRNPHAHILLTVRPMDEKGKWLPKTQKEYLCRRGEEEKAFTAEEFKAVKSEGWEKEYQYWKGHQKVWRTPSEAFAENLAVRVSKNPRSTRFGRQDERMERWNSVDAVFAYRKAWEQEVNQALERAGRPERVDCRSYEEQGSDRVSGIHLGSHASKNKDSDRYRLNETIKELNRKNEDIRKSLDALEGEIREKNGELYEAVAERLGKLRGEIASARYYLEEIQERKDALEKELQPLKDSVERVRMARENILEKDREAREKLAKLRQEQKGNFPVWSERPGQIQAEILAEQEGIRFRKERLGRILDEEGFSDIREYQQRAGELVQMEEELRQMEGKTSWYEEQIRESAGRYKELYCRISKEDAASPEFQASREKWSRIYEERTVDRIRRRSRHFRPDAFQKVLHKTDYTLGHALYLAGRTEYVMSRLQATVEEAEENDRHRSL